MEKIYEEKYHRLEKSGWWFKARRLFILNTLLKYDKGSRILDIGCSSGEMLLYLNRNGFKSVYGIDISSNAIKACRGKGLNNVKIMDASKLTFSKETFDIIIASDVLEHIEKDKVTLRRWYSLLKKGGILIMFVPAHQYLWSKHDEVNQHYRRYSKKQIKKLCVMSGFKIKKVSFWNCSLYFPVLMSKLISRPIQKIFKKNDDRNSGQLYELNNALNFILFNILKFENYILQHFNLPIGISIFILCEK